MAKRQTYAEIMEMARCYGIDNNPLFVSAAEQYVIQSEVIDMIRDALIEGGEAVTTKEYVKGRANVEPHPLIQQLPKHVDSANRTLSTMVDLILKLGTREPAGDKLGDFLAG